MFIRRVLASAVAVAVVAISLTASAITPASAAPQTGRIAAAVTETAKVTLPETSIAGPSFLGDIAWTGTDTAHHLNIGSGTDGLHFPTKTTLPETSPFGPAITERVDNGGPPPVVTAWTGTDANHSLNVQIIPGGPKLTLQETSIAAPAIDLISTFQGTPDVVLLAWTGTDANHSLNVLPITLADPLVPGKKAVLPQFSSDAGPSLSGLNTAVLGWSVRGTQRLNLATSTDFIHFTSELGAGLSETSATAPQFIQTSGSSSTGCIAWTGTDVTHHLNVQCTTQFPTFPNPKTVLPETAFGAPSLSLFNGVEIAWTGTDAAHHLNVAELQGT